jgi:hypothetical protein
MSLNIKNVASVLSPPPAHNVGDGFKVHGFFPSAYKLKMSPFFLMDYNAKMTLVPSDHPRGVGVHPHRGFETVTIAYHGAVAHHDSAGNSGVIYPGDVQWMTAGSGVLHKEYHEEMFTKQGGDFQMVQIWVNLPAKYKMTTPKYQAIEGKNSPKVILDNNSGEVQVIAGKFGEAEGSAQTFSPIEMYNIRLKKGANISLSSPSSYNTALLVIEGGIKVNNTNEASVNHLVYFKNDGEEIQLTAHEDSIVLFLSGQPIDEPIAQYGPFLMNTSKEIQQAIEDYNQGKFGFLED